MIRIHSKHIPFRIESKSCQTNTVILTKTNALGMKSPIPIPEPSQSNTTLVCCAVAVWYIYIYFILFYFILFLFFILLKQRILYTVSIVSIHTIHMMHIMHMMHMLSFCFGVQPILGLSCSSQIELGRSGSSQSP